MTNPRSPSGFKRGRHRQCARCAVWPSYPSRSDPPRERNAKAHGIFNGVSLGIVRVVRAAADQIGAAEEDRWIDAKGGHGEVSETQTNESLDNGYRQVEDA